MTYMRLYCLTRDSLCNSVYDMNVKSSGQLTQTLTKVEEYEDVDDAGSRLPAALDEPGDYHHPRGPGTPSQKELHINCCVQGSVDSGRDRDPATDGAAFGTAVRNFTQ
jgi:hypothetical protein